MCSSGIVKEINPTVHIESFILWHFRGSGFTFSLWTIAFVCAVFAFFLPVFQHHPGQLIVFPSLSVSKEGWLSCCPLIMARSNIFFSKFSLTEELPRCDAAFCPTQDKTTGRASMLSIHPPLINLGSHTTSWSSSPLPSGFSGSPIWSQCAGGFATT